MIFSSLVLLSRGIKGSVRGPYRDETWKHDFMVSWINGRYYLFLFLFFKFQWYLQYLSVAAVKSLCAKVWDWRTVLAYSAQLHNFFIGTYACNSHWDFRVEETSSSIWIDSSSSSSHTTVQWVLPETVLALIQGLSCRGTLMVDIW